MLSGIPLRSRDRNGLHNIVFAGGVCAYNPEPLSEFIDFFSLGEGEEITKAKVTARLTQLVKAEVATKDTVKTEDGRKVTAYKLA